MLTALLHLFARKNVYYVEVFMLKSLAFLSLLATISIANAQSVDPDASATSQGAPIVRRSLPNGSGAYRQHPQQAEITESQPMAGVWLRSEATTKLTTIAATAQHTEIRLEHGRLNVDVHQPSQHSEILIDLPAGQTSLLKDGLYTFNADTNTVRVLHGEAAAWPGLINSASDAKPIKIKEDHQLSLASTGADEKTVESYPYELTADLLPFGNASDRGYGDEYAGDYPRYGEPYYAGGWGYPYPYPYLGFYPGYYGFGYGVGFGYGGGFGHYGGFRGGYGHLGGFRR